MKEQLLAFMEKHKFEKLSDFKGHSVQYFTTHADLVARQAQARRVPTRPSGAVMECRIIQPA